MPFRHPFCVGALGAGVESLPFSRSEMVGGADKAELSISP
jgi:hypothetical protein